MAATFLDACIAGALVGSAYIDARSRRLPNALAVCICLLCALHALSSRGMGQLVVNIACATGTSAAILLTELAWRRYRRAIGIGMGDIKLLFALMLRSPLLGAASFTAGLICLAIAALITRQRTLPLIPFIAPVYLVMLMA